MKNTPKKRSPKLRRHPSGQGFVEIQGRRIYLGRLDHPDTEAKYHRFIAEWLANGQQLPCDPEDIAVCELIDRFWTHAKQHYRRPDGTPTNELHNFRQAFRPLRELYRQTNASQFGPKALKAVRQRMIGYGWCRTNINKQIGRVKRLFRWAIENELVSPNVCHRLNAVAGLQ